MNRRDLLLALQCARETAEVSYRGRILTIDKVMNAPPLIHITVSGWEWALSCNGHATNGVLKAIRDIDQLIDILGEVEPSGLEDAAINPELHHHVTLRIGASGYHVWVDPDGNTRRPVLLSKRDLLYTDYQITPGDFLALLRKANV